MSSYTESLKFLANDIFETFGKDSYLYARTIHINLVRDTIKSKPNPVHTGLVRQEWNHGATITGHVYGGGYGMDIKEYNKKVYNKLKKDSKGIIEPKQFGEPIVPNRTYKKTNKFYYVWNNSPYVNFLNDGYVFGRKDSKYLNFIQRSIKLANSQMKVMSIGGGQGNLGSGLSGVRS